MWISSVAKPPTSIADRLNEHGLPYLFAAGDRRIVGDPEHLKRLRLEKPVMRQSLVSAAERLVTGSPTRSD